MPRRNSLTYLPHNKPAFHPRAAPSQVTFSEPPHRRHRVWFMCTVRRSGTWPGGMHQPPPYSVLRHACRCSLPPASIISRTNFAFATYTRSRSRSVDHCVHCATRRVRPNYATHHMAHNVLLVLGTPRTVPRNHRSIERGPE